MPDVPGWVPLDKQTGDALFVIIWFHSTLQNDRDGICKFCKMESNRIHLIHFHGCCRWILIFIQIYWSIDGWRFMVHSEGDGPNHCLLRCYVYFRKYSSWIHNINGEFSPSFIGELNLLVVCLSSLIEEKYSLLLIFVYMQL